MNPVVTLTEAETISAAHTGLLRNAESLFAQREETIPGIGENGLGWTRHIEGACAELAFAKLIDRYWDASQSRFRNSNGGDVGGIQVRSTIEEDGHLILRPHDRDEDAFVLVVGCAPRFRIVGWARARDAKRPEFVRDPGGRGRPCWWIPQSALRPVPDRRIAE